MGCTVYKFLRMPFGLRNAGQSWTVLEGLDCIFVYLDNILVASNTVEEHHIHLEEVFKRLQQHGLVLHLENCIIFASSVEFLGQHMSAEGICLLGAGVAAIAAQPQARHQVAADELPGHAQ